MARLRGHIDETVTEIQIDDTTSLPTNGGVIQIEDELILYSFATDKAVLGCTRGYTSTDAVEHADGTLVDPFTDTNLALYTLPEFSGEIDPEDHAAGVLQAPKGSRYTNTDEGTIWVNTGTIENPEWTEVGAGGGGGLPEGLTWDGSYLTLNANGFIESAGDLLLGFVSEPQCFIQMIPSSGAIEIHSKSDAPISLNGGGITANMAGNSNFQMIEGAESITFSGEGAQYVSFDLQSGLRIPYFVTATRDAILSPNNGMIIINATTNKINFYSGDAWRTVA